MTTAESEIYFYAFRYCLGRMTYYVSDFCRQAKAKITEIGTHELELMDKEIAEAEQWKKENPDSHGRLGLECNPQGCERCQNCWIYRGEFRCRLLDNGKACKFEAKEMRM